MGFMIAFAALFAGTGAGDPAQPASSADTLPAARLIAPPPLDRPGRTFVREPTGRGFMVVYPEPPQSRMQRPRWLEPEGGWASPGIVLRRSFSRPGSRAGSD